MAFQTDFAAGAPHVSSEFCAIWDEYRKCERNPPNAQKRTKD